MKGLTLTTVHRFNQLQYFFTVYVYLTHWYKIYYTVIGKF